VYGLRTVVPVLLLVAVVAGAVAMWSDTLKINATIETGEVKVKFSTFECVEEPEAEGKDVGSCTVVGEIFDGEEMPVKLKVTVSNAYPSYHVIVYFTVDNVRSIPVKLFSYEFVGVDAEALDVWLVIPEDTQIDPGYSSPYELHIHVKQDAAENSTYTFELELTFAQWNEVT